MFSITLRPSYLQLSIVLAFYLLALLGLGSSTLPRLIQLVFAVVLTVVVVRELLLHCGLARESLSAIEFASQHCLLISPRQSRRASLPRVSYFTEALMVLYFESEGAQQTHLFWGSGRYIALWPDSLTQEQRRKLRRYLRFKLGV